MSDEDERCKKVAKAAIDAAKEMLATFPDDAKYVEGSKILTGKEVKKKFETDDDFAAKTVTRVVKLKFDQLKRNKPEE